MVQINIKLVHSLIRLFYLSFRGLCALGCYSLILKGTCVEYTLNTFTYPRLNYIFSVDISSSALIFIRVVSLITSVVLIFSYSYINTHYHSNMFLILLNLFVLSIMFVIRFKRLFMVILGWDGLGVISFFLILYYQSPYSIFSAWFTIIMNRLGDSFLILTIVLLKFIDLRVITFNGFRFHSMNLLTLLMVLGFITKRALFPFSPWLPIAMSAPTPISSLVHSSTLVTAGLYLIIRIESMLISWAELSHVIIWVRLFTRLYAGLRALAETDLKKLVALSTLRHLGFIGISFFRGYTVLAYFHLLAHALFKSLLFIGVGDWISSGHHYQESRALRGGLKITPFSSLVILSSSLRLLGIPFIVGFYSKDMVLESLLYSESRWLFLIVTYLNVFLTYCYTLRVLKYSLIPLVQPSPYFLVVTLGVKHYVMLGCLRVLRFIFPTLYFYNVGVVVIIGQSLLHWLPITILLLALLHLSSQFHFKTLVNSYSRTNKLIFFSFTYILNISTLYSSWMRILNIKSIIWVNKTMELGGLNTLSQFFQKDTVRVLGLGFYKYSAYFIPFMIILTFIVFLPFQT